MKKFALCVAAIVALAGAGAASTGLASSRSVLARGGPSTSAVATAAAADPILGTWDLGGGGQVVVTGGPTRFVGTVSAPTVLNSCVHPAGQVIWDIQAGTVAGHYTGTHVGFVVPGCAPDPGQQSTWDVSVTGATFALHFCAGYNNPPVNCYDLARLAPPPPPTTTASTAVTVIAAVKGKGRITGGAISCPGRCTATLTTAKLALRATAARGYRLVGWSRGVCGMVDRSPCTLSVRSDGLVTAQLRGLIWIDYIIPTAGVVKITATFVKSHS